MKNIPFTYRVTHIPTGKWYYGVRYSKKCNPSDLWTTYFTSSKHIKQLLEADGKDSFSIEIRRTFNTLEAAIDWESKVIRKILNWDNVLNRSDWKSVSKKALYDSVITRNTPNPITGLTISQQNGIKWKVKQDTIEPISGKTYRELRKEKFNTTLDKNNTRNRTEEFKARYKGDNNPACNPDVKAKISKTLKEGISSGRIKTTKGMKFPQLSERLKGNTRAKDLIWITDGVTEQRIKLDSLIPTGFYIGRLSFKPYIKKEHTCPHCNFTGRGGNMKRYHFDNCKLK